LFQSIVNFSICLAPDSSNIAPISVLDLRAIWSNLETATSKLRKLTHPNCASINLPREPRVRRNLATGMSEQLNSQIDRRAILCVLALGVSVTTVGANTQPEATDFPDKAKARYQPNSPEIQTFYRVNRYPPK
jgi:hypothetical protein